METFGKRLKEERERLHLSQTEFGDAGGVKKLAQINYEKDLRKPDAEYLKNVAGIGVDILYVITGGRMSNAATTPIELSYLRLCRMLPNNDAKMLGNGALLGILNSYSMQMNQHSNESNFNIAAQQHANYGEDGDKK